MPDTRITIDDIMAIARCREEPARFVELFGHSVEVTEAAIMQYRDKFDWNDAQRLLDAEARTAYVAILSQARIAYHRALVAVKVSGGDVEAARAEARKHWDITLAPAWARAWIATCARREVGRGTAPSASSSFTLNQGCPA